MAVFYAFLGASRTKRLRLAVMDMWQPLRSVTEARTPQAVNKRLNTLTS